MVRKFHTETVAKTAAFTRLIIEVEVLVVDFLNQSLVSIRKKVSSHA